jgi:predicted O-methyltransferase YrrM
MSDATLNLTPSLYTYLLNYSLREPDVLRHLRNDTHLLPMSVMQISPEQGQFLGLLIELLQAKKTLDIGTFTGYSALCVALALPENGKVIACDTSVEWTDIAKKYWDKAAVSHKIDLKIAPAQKTLEALINDGQQNTFDFSFIDADKENYDTYYEKSLKLLRVGGLIAIDNVLWSGRVADSSDESIDTVALRKLNSKLHQDQRVTLSMLPIGDGLTLLRKR